MRTFGRSFLGCFLALVMISTLPVFAQKTDTTTTTPYTNQDTGMSGTQTVTTNTLANGNTVTTTTTDTTGVDAAGNFVHEIYTYSAEKDSAGNLVKHTVKQTRIKYTRDPKKGGQKTETYSWNDVETYNAIGSDRTTDESTVDHKTGNSVDEHSDTHYDASHKKTSGTSTKTSRKGREKTVEKQKWNPDSQKWEDASYAPPRLEKINSQPGDGSSTETAYLPDIAGPGSTIVATFEDPGQPSGPSGQVFVAFDDNSGHRTFFKTVADAQHHVMFKVAEGVAAVWLFKSFKADGRPDDAAVKCDVVDRNAQIIDTQSVPNVPAKGPAITRASSAYERGGSANGIVSVQTRGDDPESSRLLMDGSSSNIQTLAASNMNVKGKLPDETALGRHTFSVQSGPNTTNSIPADVVRLHADPVPPGETGSTAMLTVHCDGLPPSDSGTMYFLVSGSARLEDGSENTSVPVRDGVAQVRVRGVHSGPALVKYKLQARIAGFWTT